MPILHWLTRDRDVKAADAVPYRLLERDAALSAGAPGSGNMLIHGDNLEALKSLLPYYRGQLKCIYIDPPYNTRSAFEHYDENLEHSQWLAMIWPRLELLRELLNEDGSIWVSIDDNEGHYLKVIMDEVFGRASFLSTMIWRKNYSPKSTARHFSEDHDYILVYARSSGVESGWIEWEFTADARKLIQESETYAVLNRQAVLGFRSSYALKLYEIGALRIHRRQPTWRCDITALRAALGIAPDVYKDFAQLRRKVFQTAKSEIDQLAHFRVEWKETRQGRAVAEVEFRFEAKDAPAQIGTVEGLERHSAGRRARREGAVETIAVAEPPRQVSPRSGCLSSWG